MSYTKQTWVDNQTLINATRLNHIESGIASAVQFTSQTLTDSQKAQAKSNIGVVEATLAEAKTYLGI